MRSAFPKLWPANHGWPTFGVLLYFQKRIEKKKIEMNCVTHRIAENQLHKD